MRRGEEGSNYETMIKLKTKKWTKLGPEPKKPLMFLLGKVKNNKYPEAESGKTESVDGWYYYRLSENF